MKTTHVLTIALLCLAGGIACGSGGGNDDDDIYTSSDGIISVDVDGEWNILYDQEGVFTLQQGTEVIDIYGPWLPPNEYWAGLSFEELCRAGTGDVETRETIAPLKFAGGRCYASFCLTGNHTECYLAAKWKEPNGDLWDYTYTDNQELFNQETALLILDSVEIH